MHNGRATLDKLVKTFGEFGLGLICLVWAQGGPVRCAAPLMALLNHLQAGMRH